MKITFGICIVAGCLLFFLVSLAIAFKHVGEEQKNEEKRLHR